MFLVPILACGPDGTVLAYFAGFAVGSVACVASFLTGCVLLFTRRRKLGVWLAGVPMLLTLAAVIFVRLVEAGAG